MGEPTTNTTRRGALNASTRVVLPIGLVLTGAMILIGVWMRDAAIPRISATEETVKKNTADIDEQDKRIQKLENQTPLQLQRIEDKTDRTARLLEEVARRQGVPVPP